ncbi:unnamed protein product [Clonostachys rosea]|uniref:BZIP domain-containing protein n=1 Tax=Bionectria ochroleuca TaxID=29856 RepID=A0ABY6TXG2_BIOOC|nr:unnamed protein product [Clonostachys rosea]
MVTFTRAATAGVAILSALQHVVASAEDDSLLDSRDVFEDSETALEARDFGYDDALEARDIMDASEPDLDKRFLPLLGKIAAKAGARIGKKVASNRAKSKAREKNNQRKAKKQHKKKGRRSLDDIDALLEARDLLEDEYGYTFDVRDLEERGVLRPSFPGPGGGTRARPGRGRGPRKIIHGPSRAGLGRGVRRTQARPKGTRSFDEFDEE